MQRYEPRPRQRLHTSMNSSSSATAVGPATAVNNFTAKKCASACFHFRRRSLQLTLELLQLLSIARAGSSDEVLRVNCASGVAGPEPLVASAPFLQIGWGVGLRPKVAEEQLAHGTSRQPKNCGVEHASQSLWYAQVNHKPYRTLHKPYNM